MMRRHAKQTERGQTLPFWVVATLLAFGLTYFTFNYANSVRWQVRAQNAADSAATAVLGEDAALANSLTTLEYATDVQNVKDRSADNDLKALAAVATSDKNCSNLISPNCVADYTNIANTLATDTSTYEALVQNENQFVGQTTDLAGNASSMNDLVNNSIFGATGTGQAGCVKLNTDCRFKYTLFPTIDPVTGQVIVDSYACAQIPTIDAGIVGMISATMPSNVKSKGKVFYAIGHAREELAPASSGQPFAPGKDPNSITGGIDQPSVPIDPNLTASENYYNYADLNVNLNYLAPKSVAPGPNSPTPSIATLCGPPPQ